MSKAYQKTVSISKYKSLTPPLCLRSTTDRPLLIFEGQNCFLNIQTM
jgi:hypothetical protein